jgi:hypothetical protein
MKKYLFLILGFAMMMVVAATPLDQIYKGSGWELVTLSGTAPGAAQNISKTNDLAWKPDYNFTYGYKVSETINAVQDANTTNTGLKKWADIWVPLTPDYTMI